jgi:fengycin family lipopeptide synthetase E
MKKKIEHLPLSWIETSVFNHFKEVASRFPEKIAIDDGKNKLTYQEVLYRTQSIAKTIRDTNDSAEPVIILLENNAFYICAMLACLLEGRGYIPLDAEFSHQRNKQIITHCESKTIISSDLLIQEYNLDDSYQLITLRSDAKLETILEKKESSNNIAYIIYTSGSTGNPKGVVQNERNLLHDVMQYINIAEITESDKFSLLYSPSVNGSIRDIYGSLLTGATLFINNLSKNGVSSIPTFVHENALTIYHSIPSIFRTGLINISNQNLNSVRLIYLAGDKIFKSDIDLYKKLFSDACKVYIGIGSTENATIYRQWFVDKKTVLTSGLVPVGFPVEDRYMTLIDANGNEVKPGTLGEIYVQSKYCSLGYWKDETLSEKHFIYHENGSRTVKTGDWGLINSDGLLEFKGRQDGQIKINGFRIEIGEIEAHIRSTDGVKDAAVIVRKQEENNKIVVYILKKDNITLEEIKLKLVEILPSHMYPSAFYNVHNIPYLNNFKIDYQKLQLIDKENIKIENDFKNQKNISLDEGNQSINERLLYLWCKYASYESFQKNLTWKMGGGSSLEVIIFIFSVEQEFNIKFPNELINVEITPNIVENHILKTKKEESPFQFEKKEDLVHIYAFPPVKGLLNETFEFFHELNTYFPVTLIQYPKFDTWKKDEINLENITKTIDLTIFDKGKNKIFIGNCSGVIHAYHILNQLIDQHHDSLSFFILDARIKTETRFTKRLFNYFQNNGVHKTAFRTIKSIQVRTKSLFYTKKMSDIARVKINKEVHTFKKLDIKSRILISLKNANSNEEIGWYNYLPNLTTKILPFKHYDMFRDKKNKEMILNEVLKFIDEVKEN